jgi:23S rRNA G2069 N7-methylase RlmK/C1962 C5-methylase RlmI
VEERLLRELVAGHAPQRSVAGLFATSAQAVARAAVAGAVRVVVVDASRQWLDIAQGVLEVARASAGARLAASDPRRWLADQTRRHGTWDVLACVAPAYLPAADARTGDWQAERDLPELVKRMAAVLAPDGEAYLMAPCALASEAVDTLARQGVVVQMPDLSTLAPDLARMRDTWLYQIARTDRAVS